MHPEREKELVLISYCPQSSFKARYLHIKDSTHASTLLEICAVVVCELNLVGAEA